LWLSPSKKLQSDSYVTVIEKTSQRWVNGGNLKNWLSDLKPCNMRDGTSCFHIQMESSKKVFLSFLMKEDFKVKKDGYIIIDVKYSSSSFAKLTELAEIRSNIRITPQQYWDNAVLMKKVSKSLSKTARHCLDQAFTSNIL
jgi:hypothetical protein